MCAPAYRDRDGDVWSLQPDGQYASPGLYNRSLANLSTSFGPLTEVTEPADTSAVQARLMEVPAMTREEALSKAAEHVKSLATNQRGNQDGVTFADKVQAVERLARFLMGEPGGED